MKKILFLIFILLGCNDKETSNSLKTLFDKDKIISNQNKNSYLDSIYIESDKVINDSIKLKTLFEIAAEYYYLKNNSSSLISSFNSIK